MANPGDFVLDGNGFALVDKDGYFLVHDENGECGCCGNGDGEFTLPTCTITNPVEPVSAAVKTSPTENLGATTQFAEWKKLYGHFTWAVDNEKPFGPPHYNARGEMGISNGSGFVLVRMEQSSTDVFSITFGDGTSFTPSGFSLEVGTQFGFEIERDIAADEWTGRGFVDGVLVQEHTWAAHANTPTNDPNFACDWGMGSLMWSGLPGPPYRVYDMEDLLLTATYEA